MRACIPVRLYLPVHVCLHAPALLLFVCMCVSARVCVSFHSFPLLSPVRWVLADLSSHADVGWGEDVKINTHTHALTNSFLKTAREGKQTPCTAGALYHLQPPFPIFVPHPSQHQASLPNATEMPLRQNAQAKLDRHPAANPTGDLLFAYLFPPIISIP